MAKELWTEKYRPVKVDDYVFRDDKQRRQVINLINDGALPHLLFCGQAGLGKTTLARLLFHSLEVDPSDILEINGSSENSVDDIRNKITNFISMMPFGEYRYVLIDECDYLSPNAQAALRNVMETYSQTARFILTCNYPHRVFVGLKSRCQIFNFNKLDREQFASRILDILLQENIAITEDDIDIIDTFITASYPDMRKCINNLQQSIIDGKLESIDDADVDTTSDYLLQAIQLFRNHKYTDARKVICQNISAEEYDKIFTFAYENLEFWADDQEKENLAIVCIRDAMAKAPLCADQEINVSAMFVELENVATS